jgi:hypothetical protein
LVRENDVRAINMPNLETVEALVTLDAWKKMMMEGHKKGWDEDDLN